MFLEVVGADEVVPLWLLLALACSSSIVAYICVVCIDFPPVSLPACTCSVRAVACARACHPGRVLCMGRDIPACSEASCTGSVSVTKEQFDDPVGPLWCHLTVAGSLRGPLCQEEEL